MPTPHIPPMHLRPALLTAFEAARQAGRGLYTPDPALAEALALLSERSRPACVALWRACTRHVETTSGQTTANHDRGLRAMEAWRVIVAAHGIDLTRDVLLSLHAEARQPGERHPQALSVAVWRV